MFLESNEEKRREKNRIEAKKNAYTHTHTHTVKRKREETCGKLFTMALVIQIMK